MFDSDAFAGHESLHHFYDEQTGLKALIAVHSTARGPGAGGCRMWNYPDAQSALRDVLRLSEGMSYKNAVADLPLGGAKAVIWGDSRKDKTPELFRALGRFIDSLNGVYWSAEDVGVSPDDMRFAREETRYVAGLDDGEAASGDPSPLTALGVYKCMQRAATRVFGTQSLEGVHVAVQGVGHVGGYLVEHLAKAGAKLTLTDINETLLQQVASKSGAQIVAPDAIYDVEAEIFSPNALGAVVNDTTLERLQCKLILGSANNQLATIDIGAKLLEKGLVYGPDFVVNGGGIINVASEISGEYSRDWVLGKIDKLVETLDEILQTSSENGTPSNVEAIALARRRIAG